MTRIVRYLRNQGAEDLFYCPENKKVYCRQPSNNSKYVVWLTTSKWSGGYEASSPLKDDVFIEVVDREGKGLFREHNINELAVKVYPFSYEQIKNFSIFICSDSMLKDHEVWKKWLLGIRDSLGLKEKYDFDNWLYSYTISQRIFSYEKNSMYSYKVYGIKELYVVKDKNQHRITQSEWITYELYDPETDLAKVIGYKI